MFSGCSWYLGEQKLREKTHAGTNRTLVVFLPTIHGRGFYYENQGFLEAVRQRGFEANLRILDVNPMLYRGEGPHGILNGALNRFQTGSPSLMVLLLFPANYFIVPQSLLMD